MINIELKIPEELHEQLTEFAKETEKSESEIVVIALQFFIAILRFISQLSFLGNGLKKLFGLDSLKVAKHKKGTK